MKISTIKYAVLTYLLLGMLFLILRAMRLTEFTELRLLNILIVVYFSNLVAKKNIHEINYKGYFQNFISLFRFNMLIVILSMVSLYIFTALIDSSILSNSESFLTIIPVDSEAELLFALFAEGLSASIVVSYGILQYWKNMARARKTKTFAEFLKS